LTQLIAFCGFFSMFFYATLYMQEVLHYSPFKAGAAYLPITAGFAVAGGIASQLITRIGTRPVVVAGCLIAGAGIYLVSKVPLHGSYVSDLLPGFLLMSMGAGPVFVSVTAQPMQTVRQGRPGGGSAEYISDRRRARPRDPCPLWRSARTSNLIAAGFPTWLRQMRGTTGPCSQRHRDGNLAVLALRISAPRSAPWSWSTRTQHPNTNPQPLATEEATRAHKERNQ
jgi:hypothetical protein